MSETSLSPMGWKNRREALSLLLGAPFLASAAFPQQKTQNAKNAKTHPVAMIITKNGTMAPEILKHHLSITEDDFLVLVNLHSANAWLFFENTPFQDSCTTVASGSYKILRLRQNLSSGSYKYIYGVNGQCPAKFPKPGFAGGDIIIDP
jgi:hypothetical protein